MNEPKIGMLASFMKAANAALRRMDKTQLVRAVAEVGMGAVAAMEGVSDKMKEAVQNFMEILVSGATPAFALAVAPAAQATRPGNNVIRPNFGTLDI